MQVAFEVPREGSKSTLADSTVAIGGVRSDKAIPPRLSCRQDQCGSLMEMMSKVLLRGVVTLKVHEECLNGEVRPAALKVVK